MLGLPDRKRDIKKRLSQPFQTTPKCDGQLTEVLLFLREPELSAGQVALMEKLQNRLSRLGRYHFGRL
jgi:hypothetical protein